MLNQPLWLRDLASYSLQVAVLVCAAGLLPPLFRIRLPKFRLLYWQTVLAASLLLPLLQRWRADLLPVSGVIAVEGGMAVGAPSTGAASWPLAEIVAAILAAGIAMRVAWLLLGMRRLKVYRHRARPVEGSLVAPDALLKLSGRATFLISGELASPATFGFRRPAVLLPQRFFEWPTATQRAIACHELLHVARRDWAWNLVEEIVLSVVWFHPAVWWTVRNIRLSREQAVDAEVIRLTQSKRPYLDALLEMAQGASGLRSPRSLPAPLFLRESQLVGRVALMMKEVTMSRRRLIVVTAAAVAVLLFAGWSSTRAFPLKAATAESSSTLHRVDRTQLKAIHQPVGRYPDAARRAGIQGTVVIDITVDKNGNVTHERLVSGPPALVQSALDNVKQWRFAPSTLLPARTRIKVTYTLSDHHSAHASAPRAQNAGRENAAVDASLAKQHSVVPPHAEFSPHPSYTPQALKAHLSGTVVLAVSISADGNVKEAKEITKPIGMGLDESALNTIRKWKFTPAERDGKPVPVNTKIQVTFHDNPSAS